MKITARGWRDVRISGAHVRRIEPPRSDAACNETLRVFLQTCRVRLIQRDLDGARTRVRYVVSARLAYARNHIVIQREAARAQLEERTLIVRFDVGRQNSGRRLRGAATGRSHVENGD